MHQGLPSVSSKCITREFASDFAMGECWGYNRFIQVYLLEAEDYISRMNDTLRFKYMVSVNLFIYFQSCMSLCNINSFLKGKVNLLSGFGNH